jgi:hypothetical protein
LNRAARLLPNRPAERVRRNRSLNSFSSIAIPPGELGTWKSTVATFREPAFDTAPTPSSTYVEQQNERAQSRRRSLSADIARHVTRESA